MMFDEYPPANDQRLSRAAEKLRTMGLLGGPPRSEEVRKLLHAMRSDIAKRRSHMQSLAARRSQSASRGAD